MVRTLDFELSVCCNSRITYNQKWQRFMCLKCEEPCVLKEVSEEDLS